MKTVIFTMLESSREQESLERYKKFLNEEYFPYFEKLSQTDTEHSVSAWSDNSGVTYIWLEFPTVEDFAKVWGDIDFQRIMSHRALILEKCEVKILRPGIRD
jgi:hypothetical protein